MRRFPAYFVLAFALLGGCEESISAQQEGGAALRIGASPPGEFREYLSGDTMLLQRGLQGAQHIYVGAALPNRAPGTILRVQARLFSVGDGIDDASALASLPLNFDVTLEEAATGDSEQNSAHDWTYITGLLLVVPDPQLVMGSEAHLEICVTENDDEALCEEYRGVVRWGPDDFTPH